MSVGFNKHGEVDFAVNCSITNLSFEDMHDLRAIMPVAIRVADNMWMDEIRESPSAKANDPVNIPKL